MEPDAAFVWQSESCNLTQEWKEQRSRKSEKKNLVELEPASQAVKNTATFLTGVGRRSASRSGHSLPKKANTKACAPCHSRSTAELYLTAVPAGKYSVKTSIINPKPVDKRCPRALMLSTWKGEDKKRHSPCFCPLKLGFIAASLRSKIYKNSWKYMNNSYWHLEDIWIIFNCCILIKKLALATRSLMIRQRDI